MIPNQEAALQCDACLENYISNKTLNNDLEIKLEGKPSLCNRLHKYAYNHNMETEIHAPSFSNVRMSLAHSSSSREKVYLCVTKFKVTHQQRLTG